MRRVLSAAILGAALFVGTLIIPGGRASAEKTTKTTPVEVTNVPLPVTVGNFPATQTVAGTVGATQSGVWNVKLTTPRPFFGSDVLNVSPSGPSSFCTEGNLIALAGTVIETISVRIFVPTGQKAMFGMCVPLSGGGFSDVWVPLQFQMTQEIGLSPDQYVGTVTNLHTPIGTDTAQPVVYYFDRDSYSGLAEAVVTIIGTTGS